MSRPPASPSGEYTLGEEIANSVTHGIGAVLGVVALTLMVGAAALFGDGYGLASGIVFGITLIVLYTGSTLYHAIPFPRARRIFKILDHAAIYLLIAGSYTPFCLVTLQEHGGWWLFGATWGVATVGVAAEAFWTWRPRWLSALLYLLMGWMVVFRIQPLVANLAPPGLWLLVAGGLSYTVGTLFYVAKRLRYFHSIWHVFVLGGSVCQFLAVLMYVLPKGR